MTYCLAMRLHEGLVFLSDTRTSAGIDNIGTYRKLHTFALDPQRTIVIQSAGNLATTQELLDRIKRDLRSPGPDGSLASVEMRVDPHFKFRVPVSVPGVDSRILNPRDTWADKQAYDAQAKKLVSMFRDNFRKFEAHVGKDVLEAAPILAEAAE